MVKSGDACFHTLSSPLGYYVSTNSFEGFMSLTGYNNYNDIARLGSDFVINEMVENKMRHFYIYAPGSSEKEYSAELSLQSDDFEKSTAIWAPEGSDAYDIEGTKDEGRAYISGVLFLKKAKSRDDFVTSNNYGWKFFVNCSLSWENSAESVHGEY